MVRTDGAAKHQCADAVNFSISAMPTTARQRAESSTGGCRNEARLCAACLS